MNENVIKNIRWYVKHKKINVADFEKKCGVSTGYLSRAQKSNANPSFDFMCAASKLLHVSLDTLVTLDMEKLGDKGIKAVGVIEKLIRDTEEEKISWHKGDNEIYSQILPDAKVSIRTYGSEIVVFWAARKDASDNGYFLSVLCTNREYPKLKELIARLYNAAEYAANYQLSDEAKRIIDEFVANA